MPTAKQSRKERSNKINAKKNGKPSSNGAGVPKRFKKQASLLQDWPLWQAHLDERDASFDICEVLRSGNKSPLLWSIDAHADTSAARSDIAVLFAVARREKEPGKRIFRELERWLQEDRRDTTSFALESLAWCHALPALAGELAAGPWCELLERLSNIASYAAGLSLEHQPLIHQLMAGELALTLSYLFPEVDETRKLAAAARNALSDGVCALLDGEGLPHARHIEVLRPLLGCWTRCGLLSRERDLECFKKTAQLQYEWFVRQAIRMARYDGSQMLADPVSGKWHKRLFKAALDLTRDETDLAAATLASPLSSKNAREVSELDAPEPAAHSEWAEVAILRSRWHRAGESLAVTFADRMARSELNCRNTTIWSGGCQAAIEVDGQTLEPASDWEEVCWHSDDDVDYLEIEQDLESGWRIQKQFLLAREDRFLLMCDALIGQDESEIRYRLPLPLCEDVHFEGAEETREGNLRGQRVAGVVLPLALPEWRSDHRFGSLEQIGTELQLFQQATGSALYVPVFIDLHPRRLGSPLTWRQLTVAEQLEIQRPDVAIGYRIHVGSSQWLVYRSLAPNGNRTLLGQNYSTEFFVGRFDNEGECDELLEIL